MNCVDNNGTLVDRYQRIFVRPLTKECNQVDRSTLVLPPAETGAAPPSTVIIDNSTNVNTTVVNDTGSDTTGNGIVNETITNITEAVNDTIDGATGIVQNATNTLNDTIGFQEEVTNGTDVVIDNSTNVNTTIVNGTGDSDETANSTNGTGAVNGTNTTGGNGTVVPPVTGNGTTIQCCDYFTSGVGYEFSVCEGIGAIVRSDMIGGERDYFFGNQTVAGMDYSWIW